MRKSRILKAISYILIPILVLIIILSLFYEIAKENFDESRYDENYFKTDDFLLGFMTRLSSETENLIYKNNRYTSVSEDNTTIYYNDNQNSNYYLQIKDFYYVIIYNNLALTNLELTSETDSLEGIKNFISSSEGKKANIINGNVEADSKIISQKALQYFERFNNTYYTLTDDYADNKAYSYSGIDIEEIEDREVVALEESLEETKPVSSKSNRKYYNQTIKDLQIYTSYVEEIVDTNEDIFVRNLINQASAYEPYLVYAFPICTILLVSILIYLIIAIGHSKNTDEIDINDFDKIPIEIILGIGSLTVTLILVLISEAVSFHMEYYEFVISGALTGYFVSYILCLLMVVTLIKRIKAKILLQTSIIGKILKWCIKILKKIFSLVNKTFSELGNSLSTVTKVVGFIIIYGLVCMFLIMAFSGFGAFLDLIITAYLVYKMIQRINCYKKIENHLKEIYEGNHDTKLISSEFTSEFQDIIKYINDVSRGFENAIQEGIKSERLKTELITNVSHDIRTPLTSIINYVDLLKKEEIDNPKVKEYIDILNNKSQRLKKLTEDLLEASKASSGNVKLNIEKINIIELIKQSTGEFEDKFNEKNLEIISSLPDGIVYINADNRYMYRIIENLFGNISKYALDGSRVYIDVKRIGGQVKISIKNISKEKLNISADELMQRFVRGDKSRTTEGSGLGISISKSLTEIQNGKFELQVDGDLFKVELEFDIV